MNFEAMDMRVRVAVADRLRSMREHSGLTQRELAQRVGSLDKIVCRVERAVHTPSIGTIAAHAGACGRSIYEVLAVVDRVLGLPKQRRPRPAARYRSPQ